MKKYIICVIALVMTTTSVAQSLTPQQEREFYQKAYDLINIYSQSAKLSDERDISRFNDLFENLDTPICNDLMSLSYEPMLSVSDYINLLKEADMVTVSVKVGKIWKEDGVWKLKIGFNKSISFVSTCNTLFDSYEFFGRDYQMLMTLVMKEGDSECKIRELNADGKRLIFPKDYRVLIKTDERDNNLDINGVYVKFIMDQKLLRPEETLSYRGAKVNEKDKEDACDHKVFANYNDKSWRIRIGGAYALSGFNQLGNSDGIDLSKNDETYFGIDFGYVFPTTKHLRFGVFAGVGISMNNLTIEMEPNGTELKFDAPGTADEDGDSYIRMYEIADGNGVVQEMKATDLAFPIYLDMEYEFNSKISVYADLGVKFQTSTGKMTAKCSYDTWGLYPGYGNMEIGIENKGRLEGNRVVNLNDFGRHNTIGIDEDGVTQNMSIDGLFGLGLRYNLNKSFAVDAGVQYQMGSKSWKANRENIFSYSLEEGDKVNLLYKAKDISHNALKVSVSLIYKF